MSTRGLVFAALLAFAAAPTASTCQLPPGPQVECTLLPESPVVLRGQPFLVYFTLVNRATTPPFPPPYADDTEFTISAFASEAWVEQGLCEPTRPGGGMVDIDPMETVVVLDDAASPHADDPTSVTIAFTVTPTGSTADGFWISVQAQSNLPSGDPRWCTQSTCVLVVDSPADMPLPTASFVMPIEDADAGAALPFDLLVQRNGYDPTRTLTVRVTPENPSDPVDLFPLDPPALGTTGVEVTTDEELIHFECHCHYPCFVGVDNVYHVTIHDGPTLVWDSSWSYWGGLGRALVSRAPLGRIDVLGIADASGDGVLSGCEPARVDLRLYARNPYHGVPVENLVMELTVPDDAELLAAVLHHHDNPLDAVDPDPSELVATGTVTPLPGLVRIESAAIAPRFTGDPPFAPPTVFEDLFEVDLALDLPNGAQGTELLLGELTVRGRADGADVGETIAAIAIPVDPVPAPGEVSAAGAASPLLVRSDKRTIDWEDAGAPGRTYDVHRGTLGELWSSGPACWNPSLPSPSVEDGSPPPADDGWYYLVAAVDCGISGPLGSDSAGAERTPEVPCR